VSKSRIDTIKLSRRDFLKLGGAGLAGAAVLSSPVAILARPTRGPAYRIIPLNTDWRFGGPFVAGSIRPGFDDSSFARVTLPHTVTNLGWRRWDPSAWEKTWIYRRHFDLPWPMSGRRVFVDFEGAMTGATLVLNGDRLEAHLGGYLPFSYEITGQV
jgi:beta-galactosidase